MPSHFVKEYLSALVVHISGQGLSIDEIEFLVLQCRAEITLKDPFGNLK